jgi:ferric iron reductase protein FhuF
MSAAQVLDATRTALGADAAALRPVEGAQAVRLSAVRDPDWLAAQLTARASIWRTGDRRVLATLWWYSASVWASGPTLASWLVTGQALSPAPEDVVLQVLPDSRIPSSAADRLLPTSSVDGVAAALRAMLEHVVPRVADAGGMRERPLWAIATDSLAGRLLWAGRSTGQVRRARALASTVATAVGAPLPAPRWSEVPVAGGSAQFVRRVSCCLLWAAPGQSECSSCPRRTPADRALRLAEAARATGPDR